MKMCLVRQFEIDQMLVGASQMEDSSSPSSFEDERILFHPPNGTPTMLECQMCSHA